MGRAVVCTVALSIGLTLFGPALVSCASRTPTTPGAIDEPRGGRERGARPRQVKESGDEEAEREREDRAAVAAGLSPRSLQCTSDRDCMTHRCEVALGRCRFPCRSDTDCNPPARCAIDAGPLAACFSP